MNEIILTFIATFFIWFLFAGLLILWFIDGRIKKEQVVHALFACLVAFLIANIIKHFFPTLRPFMINGGEVDVLFRPTNGAFPSEHTTTAFALAITIFFHDKKIGSIYILSALLIGLSRILANVHYPIDIVGGALIGTLTAVFVEKTHLFKFLSSKRK